ncbi:hypothetical protein THAOC_13570, partial [Thalassiosira oceanica]
GGVAPGRGCEMASLEDDMKSLTVDGRGAAFSQKSNSFGKPNGHTIRASPPISRIGSRKINRNMHASQ